MDGVNGLSKGTARAVQTTVGLALTCAALTVEMK
jgi:hypothetical protein